MDGDVIPNGAADSPSGGEHLDAERRGRTGERLILRRERQTQAHGELEVGRIVGREAPLAREWQYVSERTPGQVGIDADVELAENAQELDGARLGDPSAFLGAEQNVPDLQRPERRDVSRRGAQTVEQCPCRRCAFIFEAPGDCHRGVEDEASHRLPSSRNFFHDGCPSVWPLANALARAIGSPAPVRRGEPAGTSRATATPRRVITTSTPRATSSSNALRCVLASNVPISFITAPLTRQITSLSHETARPRSAWQPRSLLRLRADEVIQ